MIHRFILSLAALAGLLSATIAAEWGSDAPPLEISAWAHGSPVNLAGLKGKQVAVLYFFNRDSGIGYALDLMELQKKFKDVVFVGVGDEALDRVKRFLTDVGTPLNYTVAADKDHRTTKAYLEAFGVEDGSHAFVIDKRGHIAWHGDPAGRLEQVLKELAAGKYNLDRTRKLEELDAAKTRYNESFAVDINEPRLKNLAVEIATLEREIGVDSAERFDPVRLRQAAQFAGAQREYESALYRHDAAELEQVSKRLQAVAPAGIKLDELKYEMAAKAAFNEYYNGLVSGADKETLAGLGQRVERTLSSEADYLASSAEMLVTSKDIKVSDYSVALSLAKASAKLWYNSTVLDTCAQRFFEAGNTNEAVRWETEAVALARNESLRAGFEANLKKYQSQAH